MEQRKYAVLVYPSFSLQEITCLTSCLAVWFGEKIDVIASEDRSYASEDGFQVTPTKTVDEAEPSDYACIILPGTVNPLPALFDDRLIGFLRRGRDSGTLFAAISSAPALLSKAGVLDGKDFTAGYFMQLAEVFPFIDTTHFVHKPVVEDGDVITGIGMFFREFAQCVLNRLGYDVGEHFMDMSGREFSEDELTFYWSDEDYQEFLGELKEFADKD
ncbi:MAG: DJ-1/PfpI family protein [Oscillospiraceae bacterium]|nr:DJ-1/PfpI family protein [Oscillospiraceae bacterium]